MSPTTDWRLSTRHLGRRVLVFNTVSSTNDVAFTHELGTVVRRRTGSAKTRRRHWAQLRVSTLGNTDSIAVPIAMPEPFDVRNDPIHRVIHRMSAVTTIQADSLSHLLPSQHHTAGRGSPNTKSTRFRRLSYTAAFDR